MVYLMETQHFGLSITMFPGCGFIGAGLRTMVRPSKTVNIKWSHVEFASSLVFQRAGPALCTLGKIISYSGLCRYRDNTAHGRDGAGRGGMLH